MNALTQSITQHTWLASKRYVHHLFAAWLIAGWCILLFSSHVYLGAFFGIVAVIAGGLYGGYPVMSGTEEFLMSLPPTRKQQFVVRCCFGLVPIVILSLLSLAMMAFNWPQRFWDIFFSSGFTDFYTLPDVSLLWPLALTVPIALYVCSFVFASLCQRGALVLGAVMSGCGLVAGVVLGGMYLEGFVATPKYQGLLTTILTMLMATVVFIVGLRTYPNKEAAESAGVQNATGPQNRVVVAVIAIGLVVATMIFLLAARGL